jgi:hypothetical protein
VRIRNVERIQVVVGSRRPVGSAFSDEWDASFQSIIERGLRWSLFGGIDDAEEELNAMIGSHETSAGKLDGTTRALLPSNAQVLGDAVEAKAV